MVRTDDRRYGDGGFTLIELIVVVLVIAVLLAIAIPTLMAARQRANDRAAQSNARNAHVVELVLYADNQQFTDDPVSLDKVDGSLRYATSLATLTTGNVVYVSLLPDTVSLNDTVVVATRSVSGRCFWIRTVGGTTLLRFAANDCSAIPAVSEFRSEW